MHLRAVTLLLAVKVLIGLGGQRCGAIGVSKLTNFNCTSFDKSYLNFRKCHLKLNVALYKRASGYRPFLYNYTTDFCSFMAKPSRQPFMKILLDNMKNHTNLNHSCPYNHNVIIKDFVMKEEHFRFMPLPTGDYMKLALYNQLKANTKIYMTRTEQDWIN